MATIKTGATAAVGMEGAMGVEVTVRADGGANARLVDEHLLADDYAAWLLKLNHVSVEG